MPSNPIYLDNNATTRPDERVVQAMVAALTEHYANPSSGHDPGKQAAAAVDEARRAVASLIGAAPAEIVFTSGGTEADNSAVRGVLAALPNKRHLVISTVEHHAIIEMAEALEQTGVNVTRVSVDSDGKLDLDGLANAIRDDTALVSVMLANNETGVILPVGEVCRIAHARGVLVHTDAVNALGKTNVNVDELGVDLLSLSGHKIYGPKGAGALYLRNGTPFVKQQIGGGQESGRRGGTHNTPGIVGLGDACTLLTEHGAAEQTQIRDLRGRLEAGLGARASGAKVIGKAAERLTNTTCVCFAGVDGQRVTSELNAAGICVSSSAACASGGNEPSHVMLAMQVPPDLARGQLRISLGRFSTAEDVDRLLDALPTALDRAAG